MKKFLSMLLVAVMLLSVFAGCGDNDGSSSSDINSSTPNEESSNVDQTVTVDPSIRQPFQMATSVENLIVGGDFAGETSPFRCMQQSSVYTGSSKGSGDNKCVRLTGTAYAIFKQTKVPGGKYVLRYWLKDNHLAKEVYLRIYINAQDAGQMTSIGETDVWTQYVSDVIDVPENGTVSVRLDVVSENPKTIVDLDEVSFEKVPYDSYPEPYAGKSHVSRLVKNESDGSYYIEANGKPIIMRTAFASSNSQVANLKNNNYNTFTYSFKATDSLSKLEDAVKWANDNDMYLQIYFQGSAKDVKNEAQVAADADAIKKIIAKISEIDTNKKMIGVNIALSSISDLYKGKGLTHLDYATYADKLAYEIKESNHSVVTGVSLPSEFAHFIYNTQNIDYNGSELVSADMAVANYALNNTLSRLSCIPKNSASSNISQMMICAYAKNGFVGGSGAVTAEMSKINKEIANIERELVKIPLANRASFNTGTDASATYRGYKGIGGVYVKFEVYIDNNAAGLAAVAENNVVYCIADKNSYFSVFGVDAVATGGKFNENGEFEKTVDIVMQDALDGSFRAEYVLADVLKFSYYLATEPELGADEQEPMYDIKYLPARTDFEMYDNLIEDPSWEEGVNHFKWLNKGYPGQVIWITSPAPGQHQHDTRSLNLYCSSNHKNIWGEYDLGVLPAGQYGLITNVHGDKINNGDKYEGGVECFFGVVLNGTEEKFMPIPGTGGFTRYETVIEIPEKSRVKFVIKIEATNGYYNFVDYTEFCYIGEIGAEL